MRFLFFLQIGFICSTLFSCVHGRFTHEKLNATLWVQTAGEYQAISQQAYAIAKTQLDQAIEDETWTAAVEQDINAEVASLPTAVIVDVDDTIIDNSPFQAKLITLESDYQPSLWKEWVSLAKAKAIPGALDFLKYAKSKGITIFYITNRTHDEESDTRENLNKLGFPVDNQFDTVLTREEKANWGSDKISRRQMIVNNFRILLIIGDDLNDFTTGAQDNPEKRVALAKEFSFYWGTKWILIPNPNYGTWESSLYSFQYDLPDSEKLRIKNERLNTY